MDNYNCAFGNFFESFHDHYAEFIATGTTKEITPSDIK